LATVALLPADRAVVGLATACFVEAMRPAADLAPVAGLPAVTLIAADFPAAVRLEAGFAATAADFAPADLAATGFTEAVLAALRAAGVAADVRAGEPGAAGRDGRAEAAAGCLAVARTGVPEGVEGLLPAPVAGLVGAFLAAAIWVFLLANDCGLVSAWRLRVPAWTPEAADG
jgi:hypothetical protein